MSVEIAAACRDAGIIPDLERRPHRISDDQALQIDRQRGDGELGVLELLPCLGPLMLPRERQRLPELGIVVGSDRRIGEIPHRRRRIIRQRTCNRMHDQQNRIFLSGILFGQCEVKNRLGFVIEAARHVEPGEIDPRRGPRVVVTRRRRHVDQFVEPLEEIRLAVLPPFLDIEDRPCRGRRALGRRRWPPTR